jgi:hypothetical protein
MEKQKLGAHCQASAQGLRPNGMAARLALLAIRSSGLVRATQPRPEWPSHRVRHGTRTARGHHGVATRVAAQWHNQRRRRRGPNAVRSLGRASRRGGATVGQGEAAGSSPQWGVDFEGRVRSVRWWLMVAGGLRWSALSFGGSYSMRVGWGVRRD